MKVYIFGAGGNSKIVSDICYLRGFTILGYYDDVVTGECYRYKMVIGNREKMFQDIKYNHHNRKFNLIISLGDFRIKQNLINELLFSFYESEINFINCIHPSAYISPTAKIGKGNIICYGAVINSDVIIGDHNLINTYAIIEHDCSVNNYNHFAPKSLLCGSVKIGNTNLIGAGSSIIPSIEIGDNNIIGAGSTIIRNISNDQTVVGVPGAPI